MLERMGRLLRSSRPRLTSLRLVCFSWKLEKDWFESAMQEILRVSGVVKVEVFGLDDDDMAMRFRMMLQRDEQKLL